MRPATRVLRPGFERFHSHVDRSAGPNACWPWTSVTARRGYGRWVVERRGKRKRYAAHRVAFEIAHGPIPDGMCVCHTCDNPPCCNPAHLFLGTNADNLADMTAKGRRVIHRFPIRRGSANPRAKLTDDQVREIRANPDQLGTTALGRRYGVSPSAIHFVAIGGTWKHVR